jgi:hypothetical protein
VHAAINALARRRCAAAGIMVDQGITVELSPNTLANDDLQNAVPSRHITASRVI